MKHYLNNVALFHLGKNMLLLGSNMFPALLNKSLSTFKLTNAQLKHFIEKKTYCTTEEESILTKLGDNKVPYREMSKQNNSEVQTLFLHYCFLNCLHEGAKQQLLSVFFYFH